MAHLKNPFGLKDGKIVTIGDISPEDNGLRCNCTCPNCGGMFLARRGSVRIPHFAHEQDAMCDEERAFVLALYRILEEGLKDAPLRYPALFAAAPDPLPCQTRMGREALSELCSFENTALSSNYEQLIKEWSFRAELVKTNGSANAKPNVMLLQQTLPSGIQMSMAVRLLPPATMCKDFSDRPYQDIPTLIIDVSDVHFNEIKSTDLQAELLNDLDRKRWISSTKIDHWMDALLEKQHLANQKYLQDWERREQERKEKQARLAKEREESRRLYEESYQEYLAKQQEELEIARKRAAAMEAAAEEERRKAQEVFACSLEEAYNAGDLSSYTNDDLSIYQGSTRWLRCKICGQWKQSHEMSVYGGRGRNAYLGICNGCAPNME